MNGQRENAEGAEDTVVEGAQRKPLQQLERHIWRRIVSGFFVMIPLLVTVVVLLFVINFVDRVFDPFIRDKPWDFPGIGVVFSVVVLYLTGVLVSTKGHGKVAQWQNAVMSRVPVLKGIYGLAKQATDALSSPSGRQFSRVVFIEWPRKDILAMGFVTGHIDSPVGDGVKLAVYIPTAPNPTSGLIAFVSEHDVIETEITVDEAMKVVFSGGIVIPHSMRGKSRASLNEPTGD